MIGLMLLTQGDIGTALIEAAEHMLGHRPPLLIAIAANNADSPDQLATNIKQRLGELDQGQGVLMLADIYGATHTNMARQFLRQDKVEMITGVNLPMLIRALNYRKLRLTELIDKALAGGAGGIVCAFSTTSPAEIDR
ncbi:MAG: PTS sugar transporter subunit IIA [Acidiferrobacterales bacterium]